MGIRRGKRFAAVLAGTVLVSAAVWATIPGTSSARQLSPIAPGFDLFETDPGHTAFTFQAPCTQIPPGFFDPGSQPYVGTVQLGGVPLRSFNGHPVGDADTIVRRLQPAGPFPGTAVVPIELVQLHLQSAEPITVRYLSVPLGGAATEANNSCGAPALSADGNAAAFVCGASDLVAADNNGFRDVFERSVASAPPPDLDARITTPSILIAEPQSGSVNASVMVKLDRPPKFDTTSTVFCRISTASACRIKDLADSGL